MGVRKLVVPLVFLLTGLFVACGQQQLTSPLPDELAGLYLIRVEKDEIAQNKIREIHQGADSAQYESVIGTYRDKDVEALVYLTVFGSEEKSAEMMSRMVENIKTQKSPEFSYIKQFEKAGRTIHTAGSADLTHYFFQDGKRNVWISAPATLCELVLNDFFDKLQVTQ